MFGLVAEFSDSVTHIIMWLIIIDVLIIALAAAAACFIKPFWPHWWLREIIDNEK